MFNCPVYSYSSKTIQEFPKIHSGITKVVQLASSSTLDYILMLDESGKLWEAMSGYARYCLGGENNNRVNVFQRATSKLRDGSTIKEIHRIWATGSDESSRLHMIEATTSYGHRVICSAGSKKMIGRKVTEEEP